MRTVCENNHMNIFQKALNRFDEYQQKHTFLSFPVAVIKRYGDDRGGKQAALITYYGFLALFPLLLIFITVLEILVSNNPRLESQILNAVLQYFPALGDDLKENVAGRDNKGLALIAQILVLLYGARGFASILQETFNNLWHVEKEHRPGFISDNLRSAGMMLSVGSGIIVGTTLSYIIRSLLDLGIVTTILITVLNVLVTFGLFLAVFRLGTSNSISLKKLIVGAVIASIGTIIVQHFGGYIMARQLPHLDSSYGSFALALGMIFWMYLQAQVILFAITITTVRTQCDWPKKLTD